MSSRRSAAAVSGLERNPHPPGRLASAGRTPPVRAPALRLALLASCALATLGVGSVARAQPGSTLAASGPAAVRRYGCVSCHQVPGEAEPSGSSCVGCHQRVVRSARRGLGRAPHVEHYLHAPDLRRVARRLREDYLVSYLQDPHDVRPRMEETMPRLPVSARDARTIAGWLRRSAGEVAVASSPAPDRANVSAGRAVFARAGCAVCHEHGNVDFGVHLPPEALPGLGRPAYEAPNLRFVRDRMEPDVALAWILDPRTIDPDTQMPHTELSRADAIAVRDFLFLADPGSPVAAPAAPSARELAPLSRRVPFSEVRRIFERSCIHCHAHTSEEAAGALGFEASSLDLSSRDGVRRGVRLPDGSRRSILDDDGSGSPPLLGRLLRRHQEAARDLTPPGRDPLAPVQRERPDAPVGMPLGLPPVAVEDIRIIATWIAQGAR